MYSNISSLGLSYTKLPQTKFDDFWNNRAMYSLNEKYEYVIFEHDDYGIEDEKNIIYFLIMNFKK